MEITGFQRGSNVVLSWQMPARNASRGSVLNVSRVDIYRLAEPLTDPLTLSEEEFAGRSVIIATQPVTNADFALKTMSYTDSLRFAGQPVRLRYAIRFGNAEGQKAAFSNFLLLEPASGVALSPTSLSADVSQESVKLGWSEPTENIDATKPPNIIGYNVYRSSSPREAAKLLTTTPVTENNFADRFFEFGREYFYFVRAVSLGTGGSRVESSESNILRLTPKDTFPPSPPTSITVAATPTTISLFFPSNPEKDIAGYLIYRSTDPNVDKEKWEKMTPELITVTTFQDSRVETGKTYYYYVTATDKFKNVSAPSAVASETVP
ncbi:MAG TPA: hypothetical protein DEA22_03030 [Blastocatellia bacterium]|nr:hypothetical protein [Blastocatellia bacterium]